MFQASVWVEVLPGISLLYTDKMPRRSYRFVVVQNQQPHWRAKLHRRIFRSGRSARQLTGLCLFHGRETGSPGLIREIRRTLQKQSLQFTQLKATMQHGQEHSILHQESTEETFTNG